MNQERDDYADFDLPPPRRWVRDVLVILAGVGLAVSLWVLALICAVANGPRFD